MSAPTFIAKGTKSEGIGATVTPTYPAGIQAGDLIYIMAQSIQTTVGNISFGGTPVSEEVYAWGTSALFYNVATGSESGTVNVNRSGSTGGMGDFFMAQIYVIRGNGSLLTIEDSDPNSGISGTVTWDALTVAGNKRTLLAFVSDYNGTGLAAPTGYTTVATDSSIGISGSTLELSTLENISSDGSVTSSSSGDWATWHISVYSRKSRSFIVN
jgi:hypothetical protein